jgi:hypothetical protein
LAWEPWNGINEWRWRKHLIDWRSAQQCIVPVKSFRWFPTLQTLTTWLSWLNVAGTLQIKKVGIYDAGALAPWRTLVKGKVTGF